MKLALIVLLLGVSHSVISQTQEVGPGEQPQLSIDGNGVVRLIYGKEHEIYYSFSNDHGVSFSKPKVVAEVSEMHLGMTRGPQLASSRDFSIVTAMDKKGNIHCFQLDHKTKIWNKIKNVNDVEGSAPEGLMSIACDAANNFYATWLDVRDDKHNKIAFSVLTRRASWSENRIIYKSQEKSVCECCKPSVAVRGKNVSLMFRNLINGSRDLYLTTSSDGGLKFGVPTKLGDGTWKLSGCPMDGGGVIIDKNNEIHTVWQREGGVYYDQPGQSETKIADGRGCNLFGDGMPFVTWQAGGQIFGQVLNGNQMRIGDGSAVNVVQLNSTTRLAVWESDGKILTRKL